jgi:hypothetical protein
MTTLTVRTDTAVDEALAYLTSDGTSTSEAVRTAILEAARNRYYARMKAEAEALAADPDDLTEIKQVMAEMDEISAW